MERVHTDIIISSFALLESKIKLYSHLNLQDMNIHLENLLRNILNIMYKDHPFINLNTQEGNFTSKNYLQQRFGEGRGLVLL
jgi:hypothetical protein